MKKFRNYKECTDYLFGLERAGIKYDLNNIRKLSAVLGHPEKDFKSVHIAGTNGKGSVASMLSSFLTESGIKNGLYTSPHVMDFRERIRVNGKMIPKDFVISFTEKLYPHIEKIKPSFFEATTAMALRYFSDIKIEFAVVECGLGGRLDSTNIIRPEVSVITGISKDHSEYLGNTIKSITFEKAGIIKKGIPCVTGKLSSYARRIISGVCSEKQSRFIDSSQYGLNVTQMKEDSLMFDFQNECFEYEDLFLPLAGHYQVHNLKTFFGILCELKKTHSLKVNKTLIDKSFRNLSGNTGFGYRFQIVRRNPFVICDVSHNTEGIKNIRENLGNIRYKNLYIVFGMMKDKDYRKCIRELERLNSHIIFTRPEYKRAEDPEKLLSHVTRKSRASAAQDVRSAFGQARKLARRDDLILITGSFFMVSDFLKIYNAK